MSKASNAFGKFVVWLLVVILIVAVVGVALFFALREQGITYYVEFGDERYFAGGKGDSLELMDGETHEFSVKSLTGDEIEFDVKITSNADNNICFAYNGEFHYSYTGNAVTDDYSDVFGLQTDMDGFSIAIPQGMTTETAIETKLGGDISPIDELSDSTAYFVITVIVGEGSVELGFTFGAKVAGITLDPPYIIFGGDTVITDEPTEDDKPIAKEYFISYDTLSMGCSSIIEFNCQGTAVEGETVNFTIDYDDPTGYVSRVVATAYDGGEELFDINGTDGVYTFEMPAQDIIVMVYLVAD